MLEKVSFSMDQAIRLSSYQHYAYKNINGWVYYWERSLQSIASGYTYSSIYLLVLYSFARPFHFFLLRSDTVNQNTNFLNYDTFTLVQKIPYVWQQNKAFLKIGKIKDDLHKLSRILFSTKNIYYMMYFFFYRNILNMVYS